MKPNVKRIKELIAVKQWSSSEFARQMGVSGSETTRLLNGKRDGGNKVISGLIKAFPEEHLETLFFLPRLYPNGNTNKGIVPKEKLSNSHQSIPIKHPNAHQLACTVNEDDGLVEIKQGKCITTLVITPGLIGIDDINTAIDNAIKEGITKFGGKVPNKAALKLPLRDGDIERDDEAYKDAYFVNANSTSAPQIVDRAVNKIIDRDEVYSGCYARVSINFYAFNSNGSKGIACGLGNIQKVRDGEPLGGKSSAEDDFSTEIDEDFLA